MGNELKEYYISTLPDKITKAEEIAREIGTEKGLMKGKIFFHKLSGSAGSFGFSDLSIMANKLEIDFDNYIKNDIIINKDDVLKMIDELILKMKGILKNNG